MEKRGRGEKDRREKGSKRKQGEGKRRREGEEEEEKGREGARMAERAVIWCHLPLKL